MNSLGSFSEYEGRTTGIIRVESHINDFDANCYIFSTNSIISLKNRLMAMPKGSWLFCDLDDTLWIQDEVRIENMCHAYLAYSLIENEIVALFDELKNKGIYVLALTKRVGTHEMRIETQKDLLRQGVTFSPLFNSSMTIKQHHKFPAVYECGVVYVSDFKKGEVVIDLLNEAKASGFALPPEIGLIDDLMENLEDVGGELKENSGATIPFLQIHYTGAELCRKPAKELTQNEKKELADFWLQAHRSLIRR